MLKAGYTFLLTTIIVFSCAGTTEKLPLKASSEITPPLLIEQPALEYPDFAQSKGIEGEVDLYIYVDESGDVSESKIINSSNSDLLDEVAVQYVQKMKFKPAMRAGKNIGIWLAYTINYALTKPTDDFQTEAYLADLAQLLNDIGSDSKSLNEVQFREIDALHRGYINYVRNHPKDNYNRQFTNLLTAATLDKWGRFFDYFPLSFFLYYDLIHRFPESQNLSQIREFMIILMREDLLRAESMEKNNADSLRATILLAKSFRTCLKEEFEGPVPEDLNRILEKYNVLY